MTGTIQGPIYLHLAQEWLSWCDSGLWGWVACTLDSLGCLQSAAWPELAPAATNLYERNSKLLPSRYFEACHLWGKGLMLRFYSLLFTCPGRCGVGWVVVWHNKIFCCQKKRYCLRLVFIFPYTPQQHILAFIKFQGPSKFVHQEPHKIQQIHFYTLIASGKTKDR